MYIQRHYFSVKWEGVEFVRYIIKTFYIVYIWYAQLFKSMQYKKGVKNTGIVKYIHIYVNAHCNFFQQSFKGYKSIFI